MKETKHIGTFRAHDADGKEYRILVFQDFIIARSRAGTSRVPGMKSLKSADGDRVNFIEKGKYEIVTVFGMLPVTSDDPNAP